MSPNSSPTPRTKKCIRGKVWAMWANKVDNQARIEAVEASLHRLINSGCYIIQHIGVDIHLLQPFFGHRQNIVYRQIALHIVAIVPSTFNVGVVAHSGSLLYFQVAFWRSRLPEKWVFNPASRLEAIPIPAAEWRTLRPSGFARQRPGWRHRRRGFRLLPAIRLNTGCV